MTQGKTVRDNILVWILASLILLSACNRSEDIPATDLSTARSHYGTSVYLEGANHNNFNTNLKPEGAYSPTERPDCTAKTLLTAVQQQQFLTHYTLDFLQTLYGSPEQAQTARERLGLSPDSPIPDTYLETAVQLNVLPEPAQQLLIMQPQSEAELSQNLLGSVVTLNGITAQFCPEGYYVPANEPGSEPCKRVNFNQPGYPQQFVISWESPGAEWRTAVPDTQADFTEYTAVQLRATLDPLSELNPAGEPQAISIEFVDGSGNHSQAVVPQIAFPIGENQTNDYFDGGFFSGHVHMNSYRIPLTEFRDVNLENITEIALIFDQTESGTLFMADLAMVKED